MFELNPRKGVELISAFFRFFSCADLAAEHRALHCRDMRRPDLQGCV